MANDGRGSARIILVGRPDGRPAAPPRSAADPVVQRPVTQQRDAPSAPTTSGWTMRRLVNAASLGGIATVAGGLVFQKNFQLFGDSKRPLLAMGFGLFVVGMVVLTLCLIGLAGAAVRALVAGQGWAAAVLLAFAPAIPLVLLNVIGVLSYAFPAFFVIIVVGGLTLALTR